MKKYFLVFVACFQIIVLEAQTFYANAVAPSPIFNKTYQLNVNDCNNSLNIFTCPIPNNQGINYYDIALDTNQNIYYGASDGRLYRRKINDSTTCEYLGTFNNFITALVADIDGNIYAAGANSTSNVGQLYEYEVKTKTFRIIGNFPSNFFSVGDLFFYEGKLFLLGTTLNGACIIDVNTINPMLSCCYMSITNLDPLVGAFSLKFDTYSKAFVVSENHGNGSKLYEINLAQKTISAPICTYPLSILGCASVYKFSPSIITQPCGTLALQLLNFNYQVITNKVKLLWQTEKDINNDYFLIEKSTDDITFNVIGKQKDIGNSNTQEQYLFYDDVSNQDVYYRLEIVDKNGISSYSKVLFIKSLSSNSLIISPNPVINYLKVQINVEQPNTLELNLFDFTGKKLKVFYVKKGVQNIDVSFITSGVYILQLKTKKGQKFNAYFIKAKN